MVNHGLQGQEQRRVELFLSLALDSCLDDFLVNASLILLSYGMEVSFVVGLAGKSQHMLVGEAAMRDVPLVVVEEHIDYTKPEEDIEQEAPHVYESEVLHKREELEEGEYSVLADMAVNGMLDEAGILVLKEEEEEEEQDVMVDDGLAADNVNRVADALNQVVQDKRAVDENIRAAADNSYHCS